MGRIDHHRPQYPEPKGQFKKSYHLEMVADRQRTGAILRALRLTLSQSPDSVFCELGCGTGIFSIYAAGFCKKVYAVELDPKMVAIARQNIVHAKLEHKIELIEGDASTITLPEKADIVFCEMMSIWCIEEPQIPVFNHAVEQILRPGGQYLPSRIVNMAELGHFNFQLENVEIKASMPLFTGIPRSGIMTGRRVCRVLDFSQPMDLSLNASTTFEAMGDGTLNCAKLTSIVQMGPQTIFSGSDSLMPLTVAPLQEPLEVKFGDRIRFDASAHARMDLNEAEFTVQKI